MGVVTHTALAHLQMKYTLSFAPEWSFRGTVKSEISVVNGGQHCTTYHLSGAFLKENSEKQRVEGWLQELGGGLFNVGCWKSWRWWKSSRDKLNNTVYWMNRTDWTLPKRRGKSHLNSVYVRLLLLRFLRPWVWHVGTTQDPRRKSLPSPGGLIEGNRSILRP